MKTTWLICAGLLLFGVAASAAESVRIKLDLVRVEMPDDQLHSQSAFGSQYVSVVRESKRGLTVPEETPKETLVGPFAQGLKTAESVRRLKRDVYFGTLPSGDREGGLAFALVKSAGTEGYDQLCLDINGDRTIGDGERLCTIPVEKPPVEIHPAGMFTPLVSQFTVEMPFDRAPDTPADYAFQLQVVAYKERDMSPSVIVNSLCLRSGVAEIGGERCRVSLIDLAMNGRFNDFAARVENVWRGDRVIIQPEEETEWNSVADKELLNGWRMVGDKVYRLEVTPDGSEMTLTQADVPCGRLKISPMAVSVNLAGELGLFHVRQSTLAVLPAGTYSLAGVSYRAALDDGSTWQLNSSPGPSLVKVEIKPKKTAKMPYGAPFTARVEHKPLFHRRGLAMEVVLTGQGGERYWYSRMSSDGRQIPPPGVSLKTKNGKDFAHVRRSIQTSVDAIPPDYMWTGEIPPEGLVATCDLGLPWKVRQEKTFIPGAKRK